MRRGISLLECLVAIFVTALGLLGVAALIPIGTFYSGEANKNIRGWDMGQLASRQMMVQNMLDPNNWCDASGYNPTWDSAFVIDPLYFSRNGTAYGTQAQARNDQRYWYPSTAANDVTTAGPPTRHQVARLSIRPLFGEPWNDADANLTRNGGEPYFDLNSNGQWDNRSFWAEQTFTGSDDSVFEPGTDPQARPLPVNFVEDFVDDGNGVYDAGEPFADLNGDGVWTDQRHVTATSTGDYSWMITASAANYPSDTGMYNVSVVVFYKRPVVYDPAAETPSERTIWADIDNSGRDVILYVPPGGPEKYLDGIKAGQWIMLVGNTTSWNPSPIPPGQRNASGVTIPVGPVVSKRLMWCRVVSVGELEENGSSDANAGTKLRRVTIAGPDIVNPNLFADEHNAEPDDTEPTPLNRTTLFAVIPTGVVNVFERTVEIR